MHISICCSLTSSKGGENLRKRKRFRKLNLKNTFEIQLVPKIGTIFGKIQCSSRRSCLYLLYKNSVLKNLAKFTEKELCWGLFSDVVVRSCSVKNVLLKVLQKSRGSTCGRASFNKVNV